MSKRTVLAGLVFLLSCVAASGQGVKLPSDGDEYSALVARAAAHDESVDFRSLRMAYLKSPAFRRASASEQLDGLRRDMVAATQATGGESTVRAKAEQILSIDFTDLQAQKLLRQACALLHDDACADLHHFIEFGLLRSITQSGDGKTCATGWEAVQIKEEYFLLAMMGTTFVGQALVSDGGHPCDAMSVKDENGAAQTYYFKIDLIMAAEAAALGLPGNK